MGAELSVSGLGVVSEVGPRRGVAFGVQLVRVRRVRSMSRLRRWRLVCSNPLNPEV